MSFLKDLYNSKYNQEPDWQIARLAPDAVSTTCYDDVARFIYESKKEGSLLEIGCGSGKLTIALAPYFNRVVGVDLSEARVSTARSMLERHFGEFRSKVEFVVADGEDPLPLNDGEFDVVVMCAVLEHVVDVFGLMEEASRVCAHDGILVLSVPNIAYVKHILSLLVGRIPLTGVHTRDIPQWKGLGWDGGHLHYFTKSSLSQLLVHAGFIPEAWTGDGAFAKYRRWYINFVGGLTVRAKKRQRSIDESGNRNE